MVDTPSLNNDIVCKIHLPVMDDTLSLDIVYNNMKSEKNCRKRQNQYI